MRSSMLAVVMTALSGCSVPSTSMIDAARADAGIVEDGATSDAAAPEIDAARIDAAPSPDAATHDAATLVDAASSDAWSAPDASTGPDACVDQTRWGTVDDSTADAFGDEFGRQTLDVVFCAPPPLAGGIDLHVRARITTPGTEFDYDIFGTYVTVNGIGGYRDTVMSWTYVTITGATFTEYVLTLPADVDRNGTVDWHVGHNALEISTWSAYNDRPASAGADALWLE